MLCECKSGANVEAPQARKYAVIEPATVVNTVRITLTQRVEPTVVVLYICQGQHLARIKQGLDAEKLEFPVVGVSSTGMIFDCPQSTPKVLREALQPPTLGLANVLPRLIEFDQDSPTEAFESAVMAQLVAAMAHRKQHVGVKHIAERAAPHLALYGHGARNQLVKKVGEAARKIANADSTSFTFQSPMAGDQDGGVVHLLKSPEENDLRGRTQGYQALMRGNRARRKKAAPADPNQLDLLQVLEQADDDGGDDVVDIGEDMP